MTKRKIGSFILTGLSAFGFGQTVNAQDRTGSQAMDSAEISTPDYMRGLFKDYILDVLGVLPKERDEALNDLNLSEVMETGAERWQDSIAKTLQFSETMDIAILDLWHRNREHFKDDAGNPDPDWFADIFIDKYHADNSQVDIWPPGELDAAKQRIRNAKRAGAL
jgi:hypothetical protein